jgi:hypothetical protein
VYNKRSCAPFFESHITKPDEIKLPDKFELGVLQKFLIEGPIISENSERLLYVSSETLGSSIKESSVAPCFTATIIPYPDSNRIKMHTGKFDLSKPELINTMIMNQKNEIFV